MSTIISKQMQIGTSGTATDNFTIRQPATPDGTVRIANGNSGTTTDLVTVTSAGNVGIGTALPTVRLQVTGGSTGTLAVQSTGTAGSYPSSGAGMEFVAGSSADTDSILSYNRTASSWRTLNIQTGTAIFSTVGSERMRITSGGNVGIGTSSPADKLDVNGNIATNAVYKTNRSNAGAVTSGSSLELLIDGTTYAAIRQPSAETLAFYRGAGGTTETARIDSSGNLLVGTTSVVQSGRVSVLVNPSVNNCFSTSPSTNADYDALSMQNNAGTKIGSIRCTPSSTAYNTSSDYRLKNTIAPMTGALAKVAALKPVTYKWNADGSDGEGFIAHELAEVCPDAVTGAKDAVDAEGKPVYQGIDTSFLVATLTAAIQELKAEFDAYKATHP
jgi:hypothetical protein